MQHSSASTPPYLYREFGAVEGLLAGVVGLREGVDEGVAFAFCSGLVFGGDVGEVVGDGGCGAATGGERADGLDDDGA